MNLRAKFVFLIGLPGLLCVMLPPSLQADTVPSCSSGTIILDSLIGTACSIGTATFTFQATGPGVNPDGIFSTQPILFTPEIVSMGAGAFGVGFQLGPTNLLTQQSGYIAYSVSLPSNVVITPSGMEGMFIIGVLDDITGSVPATTLSEPYPDVAVTMGLCPSNVAVGGGCAYAASSVSTTSMSTESRQGDLPGFGSYTESGYFPFLGLVCQTDEPTTCQTSSADFLVVVAPIYIPEPGSLLLLGTGLLGLLALAARSKRHAPLTSC